VLWQAMRTSFPILSGNRQWACEIEARCAGLSDRERERLAKRAERIRKTNREGARAPFGYRL
jgi:hypothetical protein